MKNIFEITQFAHIRMSSVSETQNFVVGIVILDYVHAG